MYNEYFPHHMLYTSYQIMGIWLAAFLTLCIFSFLYKDNPLYKFSEHLFVGVSAGYQLTLLYENYLLKQMIVPLRTLVFEYYQLVTGQTEELSAAALKFSTEHGGFYTFLAYGAKAFIYYLLPAVIGLLILARLFKGAEWLAKYPIAYYVGYGAGYTIMIKLHSDILTQLTATVESLPKIYYHGWDSIQYLGFVQYFGGNGFIPLLSYLIFLGGLICSLLYFYFSAEHKGFAMKSATKIGIWVLMITFGAQFGFTIMARISLLIGRMQFLLGDWLGLIQ